MAKTNAAILDGKTSSSIRPAGVASEDELRSKLHGSRTLVRCDLAKLAAVEVGHWIRGSETIRYVEGFCAELDFVCFRFADI